MRRNIVKLVMFSFLLNIATGIMMLAVINCSVNPQTGIEECSPIFSSVDMSRVPTYDGDDMQVLHDSFQDELSASGEVEDSLAASYRLLDIIGLGWIEKLVSTIRHYLYGFVEFLYVMFSQFLSEELSTFLFGSSDGTLQMGALHHIISVGYIIVLFELWTNRKAAEE